MHIQITKVCRSLAAGRWFSPSTTISSTNNTNSHDIAEILLKVALNILTLQITYNKKDTENFGTVFVNLSP